MKAIRYQDFDLLIMRHQGHYVARVLNSPAGQATAQFHAPFSDQQLDELLQSLTFPRRALRGTESERVKQAKTFGEQLFSAVFRGQVETALRRSVDRVDMPRAEGASFRHADLAHANLSGVRLQAADLTGARVSGASVWEIGTDATTRQRDLIVDQWIDPIEHLVDYPRVAAEDIVVRADDIEAVHLLYLVSTRGKLKTVIDAMTERVVLLLGNFGSHRKAVLNSVRHKLADMGYAPVVFDFAAPVNRDFIETIALIAGLSRFVIADLTRPRSTPLEALAIAPHLMVPFASIIREGERPFSTFRAWQAKYQWVLPTWSYRNRGQLIRRLKADVVGPCERMRVRLRRRRRAFGLTVERKHRRRAAPKWRSDTAFLGEPRSLHVAPER